MSPPDADAVEARIRAFRKPRRRTGGVWGTGLHLLSLAAFLATWGLLAVSAWLTPLPFPALVILTFLPHAAAALIALTFTAWLLTPDHPAAPWLLAAAVAWPLGHWGPVWAGQPAADQGDPVHVVSWNVRRLWGGEADGGDPFQCVVDAMRAWPQDVVFFQEVTQKDADRLAAALALTCAHAPYLGGDAGAEGVATCVGEGWALQEPTARPYRDGGSWHYLDATAARGSQRVHLLSVHLRPPHRVLHDPYNDFTDLSRKLADGGAIQGAQAAAIAARVGELSTPVILAGDFNSARDVPWHRPLRAQLQDAYEVGARGMAGTVRLFSRFPARIDFIYASPSLPVRTAAVHPSGCSDHHPVTAELRYLSTSGLPSPRRRVQ